MSRNPLHTRLISIVEPVCQAAGFELVELRFVLEQGGWTLRICVDLPLAPHVNLIPLNRTPGYPTSGTPKERVARFRDQLRDLGVNATVRRNRGTDIDAACGQLAAGQPVKITR